MEKVSCGWLDPEYWTNLVLGSTDIPKYNHNYPVTLPDNCYKVCNSVISFILNWSHFRLKCNLTFNFKKQKQFRPLFNQTNQNKDGDKWRIAVLPAVRWEELKVQQIFN